MHYQGTLLQYLIKKSSSWNQPSRQQWLSIASNLESSPAKSKQEADPNLIKIVLWKRNQAAQPAQQEAQGTSKATKSLWAQWMITVTVCYVVSQTTL